MFKYEGDTPVDLNQKLEDVYGFRTENGTHLIDETCTKIISFWDNDTSCQIDEITSDGQRNLDMLLERVLVKTDICEPCEVLKVFDSKNLEIIFKAK